jgi:hypothetical protein
MHTQDSALPTARAAAAVLVQLAEAELLTAKLQLQDGFLSNAAVQPEFPKMEGRDPEAVIAFLNATAAAEQVRFLCLGSCYVVFVTKMA